MSEQADTIRRAIDVLYNYTSDLANPPGEGRSQWRADGWAAVDALVAALSAAEQRAKDAEEEKRRESKRAEAQWRRAIDARARADALARRVETLEAALNLADKWLDLNYGYLKPGQDQLLRELADAVAAALAGEEGADE